MEGKGKSSKRTKTTKLSMAGAGVGIAVLLLSMTLTFLTVVPVTAAEEQVEVRVSAPAPEEVEEGGTFDVTIDISDVTGLDSGQFDLSFDSSVVNATNVTDGHLDGETIPILMWTSVDADTIRVMVNAPGAEGVNGSGYLAKIGFEVKGKGGDESVLDIANGLLGDKDAMEIPAKWIDGDLKVREEEEEEEEEEVGEEVIPGSPDITTWKPANAIVNNAVGESRAFNISVNQIADISWQINGTEVQTNESTREAIFTRSAVIGTWNVSVIATNTTTGLSDMHTWIWSVTLTAITPTPTLAPGVTPTPTLAPGETPKPATPTPTLASRETPKPAPTPTPTPKPAIPGFEAIFAIAVMLAIAYILQRRR
jgi:cell division septation protein DedD